MALLNMDLYTIRTRLRSLSWLYSMERADLDAFMDAYVLFEGDWSANNGKRESHIIDYYKVINHLCALGNVEKMYFPPVLDEHVGVRDNQVLFERRMMEQIGAGPGQRMLDIGCGRGRVAAHVAEFSGAEVAGINIEPSQVRNAARYARSRGLSDRASFIQGSLNDPLPFPDGHFDGAYQIQAFTYAKDKVAVFREVLRVLRPGARFSFLDWVRLPGYDANDPEHAEIMRRTCAVIGAVDTLAPEDIEGAMREAGFEILSSRDASVRGHQSALIKGERKYYQLLRRAMRLGVKARLLPRHFPSLFERLGEGGEAFVEADERGLATTSYQIVCRKPAE